MASNELSDQEIEGKLRAYFEAEATRHRAPDDLWARINERLEDPPDPIEPTLGWRRFFWPRRWGLLPALVTTLVVLFGISGAWLFTAAPWQEEPPTAPLLLPASAPTPTVAPGMPTPVPMPATPTPAPGEVPETERSRASEYPVLTLDELGGIRAPSTGAGALDTIQIELNGRQIVSQASVSIEVEDVPAVVAQVRAIAENLGGFVGQLSSSGGPERQQSTMTIRVPQSEFFTALEGIKSLGKVRSENVGSEDVTERLIDLEARLRSTQREEESFLSLLEKAQQVSEILTIERELSRVRSDIERFQGQLNFLERRVDLATITVSLFPPEAGVIQPPSGFLTVEVSDVSLSVEQVKALVSRISGELDQVVTSVTNGKERSTMTIRVFSKDFGQLVSFTEVQGEVRNKEVREQTTPSEGEAAPSEKPDAQLDVSFIEKEPSDDRRGVIIGASVGGAALVALVGFLFYVTYRTGRRRGTLA